MPQWRLNEPLKRDEEYWGLNRQTNQDNHKEQKREEKKGRKKTRRESQIEQILGRTRKEITLRKEGCIMRRNWWGKRWGK